MKMEILNSEIILSGDYMFGATFCLILGIFVFSIFIALIKYSNTNEDLMWKVMLGIMSTILLSTSFIGLVIGDIPEYEEVKVIIHDWNVVYEEGWEIINQDGKIVTLQRKILD